jgi:BarA-like signal transduction histidine kinase
MLGDNSSVMTFLPSRQIANSLIQQYWIRVHPLARVVHRPSFERQYLRFWQAITTGFEPTFSVQAVVFAALLSAAVSMTDLAIFTLLGRQKEDLVKALQAGIEYALSRANVMRTTKTETLQAFTMYLVSHRSLFEPLRCIR